MPNHSLHTPSRRLALLTLAAGLSACVSRGSVADGSAFAANQGLLVLKMSGNSEGILNFVPFAPSTAGSRIAEKFLGSKGSLQVIKGERYYVLPVDAGEYMWSKLMLGPYVTGALYDTNRFTIKPGVMSYLGHVDVRVVNRAMRVAVEDQEADMRQHLQAQFPGYTQSLRFEKALTRFKTEP